MIKTFATCLIMLLFINKSHQHNQINKQILFSRINLIRQLPKSYLYTITISPMTSPLQEINYHLYQPFQSEHKLLNTKKKQIEFIILVIFVSFWSLVILFMVIRWYLIECDLQQCSCCKNIFSNRRNDPKVIIKFNHISQRDYCTICLQNECDLVLQCTHYFHKQCFNQWLKTTSCCPICKSRQMNQVKIIICMKCKENCIVIKKEQIFTYQVDEQCCLNNE